MHEIKSSAAASSKSYRRSDNIRSHHCMEFSLCDARGEKREGEGFRGIIREEREREERASRRQPEKLRSVKCSAAGR